MLVLPAPPPAPPSPPCCLCCRCAAADASFSLSRRDLSVCTQRAPTPGPGALPSLRAAPLGPLAFLELPPTPRLGLGEGPARGRREGASSWMGGFPLTLGLPGVKMGEAAPTLGPSEAQPWALPPPGGLRATVLAPGQVSISFSALACPLRCQVVSSGQAQARPAAAPARGRTPPGHPASGTRTDL